jgi:PAS domain S-box-containing protein
MNNIISLNDLLVIYNMPCHLVVVLTLDGKFEYVNTSVGTLLGYWEENLLGNHFSSIIHPEDSPDDVTEFFKTGGTTYTHTAIKRARTTEGTYRFFSWSFTRPADSRFVYAIAQDCTDTMELEEIFRFSSLKHSSPGGISIIDENKTLLWSNKSFTRITGYTRKEMVNKNLLKILSGSVSTTTHYQALENKIDAGLAFSEQCIFYNKNGQPLWMRIDAQPLFDKLTGYAKWFLVHSDITSEKLQAVDQAAGEATGQLQKDTDLPCILVEKDTGKIIYANNQAQVTYQYTITEFQSLFFKDLLAGLTPVNTTGIDPLLGGKHATLQESYHKKKNGEVIKVQSTFTVDIHNGTPVIKSTHKDISANSIIQNSLDKRDCLKNIAWKQSHLMRSPLTNLKSLLVFLREDVGNIQFMDYMQTELDRLDNVIKEIVYETSIMLALDEHLVRSA